MSEPPLRRTLSSVERDTLSKAMEVIKMQENKYRAKGLSTTSFFFGVINVFLIGFVIGKWPEHYWVLHLFKCFFYFGIIWWTRIIKDNRDLLSLIEICWVVNHLCMLYIIMLALTAFGIKDFSKIQEEYGDFFFKMYWGCANGPLAAALVMLGNAMVFHDLPNLASCFIHLTPCSVTWSLRWFKPQLQAAYPNVFVKQTFSDHLSIETNNSFLDVVYPALTLYYTWLTLYCIFMIAYGRFLGESDQKIKEGQWDTAYAHTVRHVKPISKLVGYSPKHHSSISPFLKFMFMHALFATVMICFSYVFWKSFIAHTCYCLFLFMVATYNGSVRYVNMMTKWYQQSLQKLVNEKKKIE